MSTTISTLWITLIGMGLVFIGILALWGLMELIVKLTNRYDLTHPEAEEGEEGETSEAAPVAEARPAAAAGKQQAAAVAVAIALALQAEAEVETTVLAQPQNGQASAWQAVMRSAQLTQRSNQFSRKSRGNVR